MGDCYNIDYMGDCYNADYQGDCRKSFGVLIVPQPDLDGGSEGLGGSLQQVRGVGWGSTTYC